MGRVEVQENTPTVGYTDDDLPGESAVFVRLCPHCGRFVKSDDTIKFTDNGPIKEPNATCSKCGRVTMQFDGYWPNE